MTASTVVVIPTLNEVETIGGLVTTLIEKHFDVIVVDAGSADGTADSAAAAGATVIRDIPGGIRVQVLVGVDLAVEDKYEFIVTMDAGGSHNPDDVSWLLAGLDTRRSLEMAIGSRFLPGSVYRGRPLRKVASWLVAQACNALAGGEPRTDWTSGFRAYRPSAANKLIQGRYWATMHGWQIESLGYLRSLGTGICDVPIRYTAGRSSLRWGGVIEAITAWLGLTNRPPIPGGKVA